MGSPYADCYEFGPFRLDAVKRLLWREGELVLLRPKTLKMLQVLVENSSRVGKKEELMNAVWADTAVEDNNLTVHISALRRILGGLRNENRYIVTVPGQGYQFVAPVREVAGDAGQNARQEIAPARGLSGTTQQAVLSIAVFPFRNLSGTEAENDLGLGMADALITGLSHVPRIAVRPTSAILSYLAPSRLALAAGRDLAVDFVVDGAFQQSGPQLRVTVQLVKVGDGVLLWADTFDEQSTNIFLLQDAILDKLTKALKLKVSELERQQMHKHSTEDLEAYHLYLRGRSFWQKRTGEAIKKGIDCFERALLRDPGYALAYAGLADSYIVSGSYNYLPRDQAYPQARAAAERALLLDPSLAEAHTSLAHVRMYFDWNWLGAAKEFRDAIAQKPNCAIAHHWLGVFLTFMGEFREALAELGHAQKLDPLSLNINVAFASTYFLARQYELAIEQCQRILDLDPHFAPAHFFLGMAYSETPGMGLKAIEELQYASQLLGSSFARAILARAYATSGDKKRARQIVDELADSSEWRCVSPLLIAIVHTSMGKQDQALDCVERAYHQRSDFMVHLKVEPLLDPLRGTQRFQKVLQRMRFPSGDTSRLQIGRVP